MGKTTKSELAWICGIVPKATNQRIVALCKELNASVGLPETVFRFPLDRFDRDFNPHVSLFTSGKPEQIQEMFDMLREEPEGLESLRMTINRFVIGASGHRDVFYEV